MSTLYLRVQSQFVATDEESVQQQLREEMIHSDVDIRSCQRSVDDARRL